VTFRVDAFPNDTFTGAVEQVRLQPTTVQNVVTYQTVIAVPNQQLKLKPGMTANVTIEVSHKTNVLRIPSAATRFRPTADVFAALNQEVPPEARGGFGGRNAGGRGGRGGNGQGGPGGPGGPGGAPGGAPAANATAPPPAQPTATAAREPRAASAEARGGGDRAPQATATANAGRQNPGAGGPGANAGAPGAGPGGAAPGAGPGGFGGGGRGFDPNMTPEERRKRMEERMAAMTPEERAAFQERMAARQNGQGGGRGGFGGGFGGGQPNGATGGGAGAPGGPAPAGAVAARPGGATRGGPAQGRVASVPSMTSGATTIDSLFGPLPTVETRGRAWLYINKQLKPVSLRLGISDGTNTEVLDGGDLQVGTEVVTNIILPSATTAPAGAAGGAGQNPLLGPQRGGPGGNRGGGGGRGF
jgi:hypothetical protein